VSGFPGRLISILREFSIGVTGILAKERPEMVSEQSDLIKILQHGLLIHRFASSFLVYTVMHHKPQTLTVGLLVWVSLLARGPRTSRNSILGPFGQRGPHGVISAVATIL
jgi:hypothetical protein